MLYFAIKSLAKVLLPSISAALPDGPKIFSPFSLNLSTIPIVSGTSGPTTVKSIFCSTANASKPSKSSALIFTHSAICAIPAFPGAQYIFSTFGLWLSFHTNACSLPPLPTTRTLILFLHTHISHVRNITPQAVPFYANSTALTDIINV